MSENSQCCKHDITSCCCNCGDCCLIHEQFDLCETLEPNTVPITIYAANNYRPACVPSGGTTAGTTILPFGTIIVKNLSNVEFILILNNNNIMGYIVPAMGSIVINSSEIGPLRVEPHLQQICALFKFDIFFPPPAPETI